MRLAAEAACALSPPRRSKPPRKCCVRTPRCPCAPTKGTAIMGGDAWRAPSARINRAMVATLTGRDTLTARHRKALPQCESRAVILVASAGRQSPERLIRILPPLLLRRKPAIRARLLIR
jgi:hypothetical protein